MTVLARLEYSRVRAVFAIVAEGIFFFDVEMLHQKSRPGSDADAPGKPHLVVYPCLLHRNPGAFCQFGQEQTDRYVVQHFALDLRPEIILLVDIENASHMLEKVIVFALIRLPRLAADNPILSPVNDGDAPKRKVERVRNSTKLFPIVLAFFSIFLLALGALLRREPAGFGRLFV